MKHVFIINPNAGKRDQTARIYDMADRLRDRHGLECACMLTERPGGATEMARKLAQNAEDFRAYARVGDGTVHAVAEGRATVAEAIAEVKLRSRQYAKRQLTWLRRNEAIHWILWAKPPDFSAGSQNATEFLLSAGVC